MDINKYFKLISTAGVPDKEFVKVLWAPGKHGGMFPAVEDFGMEQDFQANKDVVNICQYQGSLLGLFPGDQVAVNDTTGTWQVIGFEEGMVRCKQGDIELCFDKENINAANTPG